MAAWNWALASDEYGFNRIHVHSRFCREFVSEVATESRWYYSVNTVLISFLCAIPCLVPQSLKTSHSICYFVVLLYQTYFKQPDYYSVYLVIIVCGTRFEKPVTASLLRPLARWSCSGSKLDMVGTYYPFSPAKGRPQIVLSISSISSILSLIG